MDDLSDCIVGAKQVKKALASGNATRVYLAMDADPEILDPIRELCRVSSVEIVTIESMKELGDLCSIDVKAACACVPRK